ncbi:acid-shock protein [Methylobacter tundripaludum]|uniref:acid-shock protein n=2 Tax=Methylobacter tundripaludum TaxID=173365 RepID=UPI001F2658CF|nr:acid-shock protein [Methylobacter tundripaludum]
MMIRVENAVKNNSTALFTTFSTQNNYFNAINSLEETVMKSTYIGLALAACLGIASAPLLAEVVPAPEHPANISAPATSPTEHQEAAALHKKHAEHHKGMAEHHKSVAAEYGKAGHHELKKHHEAMAKHHEALAKEHEKAAENHEKMAKPK